MFNQGPGQPAHHAFISYSLRRVPLCVRVSANCDSIHARATDDSKSGSRSSTRACMTGVREMSCRSSGDGHIMVPPVGKTQAQPVFNTWKAFFSSSYWLTLSRPMRQHSRLSSPLNNDKPTLEGRLLTWSPACIYVVKKHRTRRSSV